MRIFWAFLFMAAPALPPATDGSSDVMRLLLSNADLVVVGEIEQIRNFVGHEANTHRTWNCSIRVVEVLKGKAPPANPISAGIDILAGHPFTPKKGDKWVLFLTNMSSGNNSYYVTTEIRFGVQPVLIASDLKRLAEVGR